MFVRNGKQRTVYLGSDQDLVQVTRKASGGPMSAARLLLKLASVSFSPPESGEGMPLPHPGRGSENPFPPVSKKVNLSHRGEGHLWTTNAGRKQV